MNNRIKEVRNCLKLSQENFGKELGITKSAISKIELGENKVTESMSKLICSRFGINKEWLKNGVGEMFVEQKDYIFEQFCEKYNLEGLQRIIILQFLKLDDTRRKVIIDYIQSLIDEYNKQQKLMQQKKENNQNQQQENMYAAARGGRIKLNTGSEAITALKKDLDKIEEQKKTGKYKPSEFL